jgi:hypothetical protein
MINSRRGSPADDSPLADALHACRISAPVEPRPRPADRFSPWLRRRPPEDSRLWIVLIVPIFGARTVLPSIGERFPTRLLGVDPPQRSTPPSKCPNHPRGENLIDSSRRLERDRDRDAFRADAPKIGLAGVEDEPSGLCDPTDLLPSLSGAVLRPSAPRQRVPSLRARRRTDPELRAGHRRKTPADRLHLGSIFDSCRSRRWEARYRAASDLRLHPPLARSKLARVRPRASRGRDGRVECDSAVSAEKYSGEL